MTIRDRLIDPALALTPSERKLVRVILANYPVAGLGTVATLAERADVSDPTVVRFSTKLGFASFTAFQEALLGEVEQRLRSPLMLMEVRQGRDDSHPMRSYSQAMAGSLTSDGEALSPLEFDRALDLLIQAKGRLILLGGRFSGYLAGIMEAHLRQMRSGTLLLSGPGTDLIDRLADLTARDVLVVFDYRRYQSDVVTFARQAKERGLKIVLFTDRWGSPIADEADVVLAAEVEAPSLFDTMVPALAQVEAVVTAMVERIGKPALQRIEALEQVRGANKVTVDRDPQARDSQVRDSQAKDSQVRRSSDDPDTA
ncbi:MurR/RpiR family transcriptional regulator [Phreatobacter stygius]|uniref:MurR/RpiR family transcriptional regulator n=1 Tax=Phreatobacter stygius TaxID=1940610 RepID=A0A4D7BB32_9HYPH|nr:MurR/RpiR family transcriptional regulator [Phreatobacter stygius]QCI67863.1 MurR/RpiR family transcriptional regulator [Phreatobacter stygius]